MGSGVCAPAVCPAPPACVSWSGDPTGSALHKLLTSNLDANLGLCVATWPNASPLWGSDATMVWEALPNWIPGKPSATWPFLESSDRYRFVT